MKAKNFIIRMEGPCSESWEQMNPVSVSVRFCASCSKVVTDFSLLSDEELIAFLEANPKGACGRFREDQIDRELSIVNTVKKNTNWLKWIAASLVLGSTASVAQAQTSPQQKSTTVQTDTTKRNSTTHTTNPGFDITGRVVAKGSNTPIRSAYVLINGTEASVQTDSLGNFTMHVPPALAKDSIECSVICHGYAESNFTYVRGTSAPVIITMERAVIKYAGYYAPYSIGKKKQ